MHEYLRVHSFTHEYSLSSTHALFSTNMHLQNEFRLQPNTCFARNLDWTKNVALNHGKNMAKGGGPLPGHE